MGREKLVNGRFSPSLFFWILLLLVHSITKIRAFILFSVIHEDIILIFEYQ